MIVAKLPSGDETSRCRILTYHELFTERSDYVYSVSREQFEQHLRILADRNVILTFDDGHSTHFENALPLLEEYRRRAIFFVTASWTEVRPGYMTWSQLRETAAAGHEVQAHSWSHKFLTDCSEAQLKEELVRPKKALEDGLGQLVDAISVPGGRWNRRTLVACAAAGYRRVYVSNPWNPRVDITGVTVLGRIMVHRTMDSEGILRVLNRGPAEMRRVKLQHNAKLCVQHVLGSRLYKLAWNLLGRRGISDRDGL